MERRWTILGWLCLIFPGPLMAQPGVITTIAGMGGFSGDGGLATQASLFIPKDVAVDANGNVYIADQGNDRIRRVDRNGIITTIAGGGDVLGDGGPAIQASLDRPSGVAVDAQGVIYIADTGHHRIRRVSLNGIITTLAGTGNSGYSGDGGLATQASLNEPTKVAADAQGVVYITEPATHRVRRVDSNGIITTLAGTGRAGFTGDGGPARFARLNMPSDVAVDAQGFVYIADTENRRVRRVDSNGIIMTFAGGGNSSGDGGPATQANIGMPRGVAVDARGFVYAIEDWTGRVFRMDRNGTITTFAFHLVLLC